MGRIKTKLTKRLTNQLILKHGEKLGSDFNANKVVVSQFVPTASPKIRNTIAGYATRLQKVGTKSIHMRVQQEKAEQLD